MAANDLCMCAFAVAVVAVQVRSTAETCEHSHDGIHAIVHQACAQCLSTLHSHVIDQLCGLEVGLVVVLSVELGSG